MKLPKKGKKNNEVDVVPDYESLRYKRDDGVFVVPIGCLKN